MNLIYTIMGQGTDPKGDCLGLRPFLKHFESDNRQFIYGSHEDSINEIMTNLERPYEKRIIIAHSFGVDQSLKVLNHPSLSVYLDAIFDLDGKPKDPLNWWQFFTYQFPFPGHLHRAFSFVGWFGQKINIKDHDLSKNTSLGFVKHADVPSNKKVQAAIKDYIEKFM